MFSAKKVILLTALLAALAGFSQRANAQVIVVDSIID